jgi:hypothetical protein
MHLVLEQTVFILDLEGEDQHNISSPCHQPVSCGNWMSHTIRSGENSLDKTMVNPATFQRHIHFQRTTMSQPLCLPCSTPEKQDTESSTEKHQNDRISSQEPIIPLAPIQHPQFHFITVISCGKDLEHSHLTNKPILINRSSLLSLTIPRRLSPHLLHILQHHITMPIKSLHTRE